MSIRHNNKRFIVSHYTNLSIFENTTNMLIDCLTNKTQQIVIVCIGTDRSTGDSLGPQTGTYLSKLNPKHLHVLGTLHKPVHALNLDKTIIQINSFFDNPFIIAVDAALGKTSSVGNIICAPEPVRPGAAFNKELPAIGNVSLTGVVNSNTLLDYTVLQCTRLSLVYDMAKIISSILYQVDLHIDNNTKYNLESKQAT